MCGIFGFAKTSGRQSDNQMRILRDVFTELTDESSIRGTDSTGFSIIDSDNRFTYKTLKDSSTLVDTDTWDNDIISKITRDTTIVMGHVRLATHGKVKVTNAHPFTVGNVTGVHNGVIYNYNQVAKSMGKSVPEVDSQVLFQSLYKNEMNKAFENIEGDFALTWVKDSNRKVHLARESGRPIVVAYWKKARILFWASTKNIMQDAILNAGLVLPIQEVPEDYIYTYNVDAFNSTPNREQVAFETLSQYGYKGYTSYGYSNYGYGGYSAYDSIGNPSPASKHLPATCDTKKEMCSYCYEWINADELWHDKDNKQVCFDCEYFVDDYDKNYAQEDKREGGKTDEKSGWFKF